MIAEAMQNPIGGRRVRDLVHRGQRVAIVTSDMTRPCPSELLIPPLLSELNAAGIRDENICIVIGLGLHRPMTADEWEEALGSEVLSRIAVVNHDPRDVVSLGTTSRGTPVELFRPVVEADVRVGVGVIEFHYFAGFSGGAKAFLPGCASPTTIQMNHSMMLDKHARAGILEENPVRNDIEEGTSLLGVDFILNAVVDSEHQITHIVAGDVTRAHRVGCEHVIQRGRITIPQQADIVLASAGGFPKDINLYQAQKALDNAAYAVRDGGIVILVAECPEGFGNKTFEEWLRTASEPAELLNRIRQQFVLGGHKAAAIASVLEHAPVFLVSAIPSEAATSAHFIPFSSAQEALNRAIEKMGTTASIAVFPQAASVLPFPAQ